MQELVILVLVLVLLSWMMFGFVSFFSPLGSLVMQVVQAMQAANHTDLFLPLQSFENLSLFYAFRSSKPWLGRCVVIVVLE